MDNERSSPRATEPVNGFRSAQLMKQLLPRFTEHGFDVFDTPPSIHERLRAAYSSGLAATRPEGSDPAYLTAGDPDFIDIGSLATEIADELRPVHEAWSGKQLEMTAAYGLRIYRAGQVLGWHADRADTHVISSIIHIDRSAAAPWPLHIVDHGGMTHQLDLVPGQMLLYESATCAHARPTPFNGEHYGSLFVHFRPRYGWDLDLERVRETVREQR